MFEYELQRFRSGVLFFYFGGIDLISHMFWRTLDPSHPLYDPVSPYRQAIVQAYQDSDAVLGRALERLDNHTTLLVVSDHGFAPFYRAFHLNTWLKKEGYITLIDASADKQDLVNNVNWAKTRAYGLGLYGLYVNLRGREKIGIVRSGEEYEALINELTHKLLAVRDPKTGQQVVAKVYRTADVYTGPYTQQAPDLIVGYSQGYRSSWETVIGQFSQEPIEDNTGKWSGDHSTAEQVPGILLTNKPLRVPQAALSDLAPTILAEFGIPTQPGMVGKVLL